MSDEKVVLSAQWLKDEAGDVLYQYFDPFRAFFRYMFGTKHYRVKFMYDNGMTAVRGSEMFTASNDHEARRRARKTAGVNALNLTLIAYREVKIK